MAQGKPYVEKGLGSISFKAPLGEKKQRGWFFKSDGEGLLWSREEMKYVHRLSQILEEIRIPEDCIGAFLCSKETFRLLYNMEQRHSARSGWTGMVMLCSLVSKSGDMDLKEKLLESHRVLTQTLLSKLRMGDVIAPWNEAQVMLMLADADATYGKNVTDRIRAAFEQHEGLEDVEIQVEYGAIEIHPHHQKAWDKF